MYLLFSFPSSLVARLTQPPPLPTLTPPNARAIPANDAVLTGPGELSPASSPTARVEPVCVCSRPSRARTTLRRPAVATEVGLRVVGAGHAELDAQYGALGGTPRLRDLRARRVD